MLFFLLFNFSIFKLPKLFLGDSGSLLLGFIVAFTLIYLKNNSEIHPILLAWSISIFVFEFLSIHIIRFRINKKIFQPGQDFTPCSILRQNFINYKFLIVIMNIVFFYRLCSFKF